MQELRFFALGGISPQAKRANPKPSWLTSKQWAGLNDLSKELPNIFGPQFISHFEKNVDKFETLYKQEKIEEPNAQQQQQQNNQPPPSQQESNTAAKAQTNTFSIKLFQSLTTQNQQEQQNDNQEQQQQKKKEQEEATKQDLQNQLLKSKLELLQSQGQQFDKDQYSKSPLVKQNPLLYQPSPTIQFNSKSQNVSPTGTTSQKGKQLLNTFIQQQSQQNVKQIIQQNPNQQQSSSSSTGKNSNIQTRIAAMLVLQQDQQQSQQQPNTQLLKNLTDFQRLILLRILRPDLVQQAIQCIVRKEIGDEFTQIPPLELEVCYQDSSCFIPIIFILSPGTDPREQIIHFSVKKEMSNQLIILSLGQGQTDKAKAAITEGMKQGQWILLQNCHLSPSFMPILERLVEGLNPNKSDFRLWLTTYPTPLFPITVLQKSLKLRTEAPKGLKNMLRRAYGVLDLDIKFKKLHERYEHSWQRIFFTVCFFHAVVQERKKFGPIGWKQPYEFNFSDLAISFYQIATLLESTQDLTHLPWDYLTYLVSETNYGGRVTDPHDQRTLSILARMYLNRDTLTNRFSLVGAGEHYKVPGNSVQSAFWIDHLATINNYPNDDLSYIFGMHENSAIVEQIFTGQSCLDTLLQVLPKTGQSSGQKDSQDQQQSPNQQPNLKKLTSMANQMENTIIGTCRQIISRLQCPAFDLKKLPNNYQNSMNIVLLQEVKRYNKLIELVHLGCKSVISAFEGQIVLDEIIEEISSRIFDNIVPLVWKKSSYPSTKPLGSWINNLMERIAYLQSWVERGEQPTCFWISSFFLTTSFLTGIMQNFARISKVSVDSIKFQFEILSDLQANSSQENKHIQAPQMGCYIYGLFLDGAKWNYKDNYLAEPDKGKLFSEMPMIWLIPKAEENVDIDNLKIESSDNNQKLNKNNNNVKKYYDCPVYQTPKRAIEISLSGMSSNWIFDVNLPLSGKDNEQPEKWTLQGVALLTQLDY